VLQAKQRAEVLQSTHKFFEELKAPQLNKVTRLDQNSSKPPHDVMAANHQAVGLLERPEADKPPLSSAGKPIRTGPIKPQAVKPEEGK